MYSHVLQGEEEEEDGEETEQEEEGTLLPKKSRKRKWGVTWRCHPPPPPEKRRRLQPRKPLTAPKTAVKRELWPHAGASRCEPAAVGRDWPKRPRLPASDISENEWVTVDKVTDSDSDSDSLLYQAAKNY